MSAPPPSGTAGVDGVPGEQSVCPSLGGEECRPRPLASLSLTAGRPRRDRRGARARRPCRQGKAAAARTLGRRAAACGARPRAGARPAGAAARRAVRSLGPALRDDMLDLVAGVHAERGDDGAVRHASAGRCARIGQNMVFLDNGTVARRARPTIFSTALARKRFGAISAQLGADHAILPGSGHNLRPNRYR